jgi:hypothetical protein
LRFLIEPGPRRHETHHLRVPGIFKSCDGKGPACLAALAVWMAGCATTPTVNDVPPALAAAVDSVDRQFAPDPHAAICRIAAFREGGRFVLRGDVVDAAARPAAVAAAARAGFRVRDEINVLPPEKPGDLAWGIATLSVVTVREKPDNPAEMGTQMLTGEVFRVWKKQTNWFLAQTADGYVGWVEGGGFFNCTRAQADDWNAAPHP